ncbi:5'/3'-nucleotidase SurE [Streptomyces sp. NPDC057575]|uniref:5'/3'-nucleotidase SurE n=1 Tax=unclassified Streptomyces TaxID=2593676 RepID=UPI0036B05C1E
MNSGPNARAQANDSGTVGAAVDEGVPALALSSTGDESEGRFPRENHRATAESATRFVAGLEERSLLTSDFVLKADHPDVSAGHPAGAPRWTSIGHGEVVRLTCEETGESSFGIGRGFCEERPGDPCTGTVRNADAEARYGEHRISVAPVTADRTYGAKPPNPGTLRKTRHYVEHEAPRG